jgi:hypothetical protein
MRAVAQLHGTRGFKKTIHDGTRAIVDFYRTRSAPGAIALSSIERKVVARWGGTEKWVRVIF